MVNYLHEKKRLRIEINDVIETYCHVCPFNKSENVRNTENPYCKSCEISARLKDLGNQLIPNHIKHQQERHIPLDDFVPFFEKAQKREIIASYLGCSVKTVSKMKKIWREQRA